MGELTSKVFHMELRRDDAFQTIIIEDDFNALGDQAAVKQLDAWMRQYVEAWRPEHNVIGVLTNVWTEECLAQPTSYCWARYSIRPLRSGDITLQSIHDDLNDEHTAQAYLKKEDAEDACEELNEEYRRIR